MEPKAHRIFISYAWESDEHREWVRELATRLGQDGLTVRLDQWSSMPGDQLTSFMERAIQDSEYVIIVCTPDYKEKCDNRVGGVGYEGNLMAGLSLITGNDRKFVPVLKQGSWTAAAPTWLAGKHYVDLSSPGLLARNYGLLLSALRGEAPAAHRIPPAPTKGTEVAAAPEKAAEREEPKVGDFSVEIEIPSPLAGSVCWYAASSTRPDPERLSWTTLIHQGLTLWRNGERRGHFQAFLVLIEDATREPVSLVLHQEALLGWALPHGRRVEAGEPIARVRVRSRREEEEPVWSTPRGPAYGNVLKLAPVLSDPVWQGAEAEHGHLGILSSAFNPKYGRKAIESPAAGVFESREPRLKPGDPVAPNEPIGWIRRDDASVPVVSDVAGTFVASEVKNREVVHRRQPLCQLRFGPSLLTVLVSPCRLRQRTWHTLLSPVPGRFVGGITGTGKTRASLPGAKVKFSTPICAVVSGDLLVGVSADLEGEVLDVAAEIGQQVRPGQPLLEIRAERLLVRSPLVGTFFRAKSPDSEPFVEVGARVRMGQVLCIIEAMKLKNEIESPEDGVVEAIFPQNGQGVEWNQPLFRLRIPRGTS